MQVCKKNFFVKKQTILNMYIKVHSNSILRYVGGNIKNAQNRAGKLVPEPKPRLINLLF